MSAPSGQVFSVVGDRYIFLVTGAETGGAYAIIEAMVPPGSGPPSHVHHREDEAFHIISGEIEFTVAGKQIRLGPGESLFARRGIPHSFKNVGANPAIMTFTVTPSGLEDFFAEVGTRLEKRESAPVAPTKEDVDKLFEAAPRYGMELLK